MKQYIFAMIIAGITTELAQAQVENTDMKVDSAKIWFDRGVQGIFNDENTAYKVSCYSNALRFDPKMIDAYRYRAADYFKLNKFQECLEDCNHYFNLVKSDKRISKYVLATMHFRRAEALAMLGRYKEAKPDYDRAVEYVPSIAKYVEGQQRNTRLLGGK